MLDWVSGSRLFDGYILFKVSQKERILKKPTEYALLQALLTGAAGSSWGLTPCPRELVGDVISMREEDLLLIEPISGRPRLALLLGKVWLYCTTSYSWGAWGRSGLGGCCYWWSYSICSDWVGVCSRVGSKPVGC